jgi:HEAT repeat protein
MIPTQLLDQLKSNDPEIVKDAVIKLSALQNPAAIEYLEPLKKHKNTGIRYFSKKAIDKLQKFPPEPDPDDIIYNQSINSADPSGDTFPANSGYESPGDFDPQAIYSSETSNDPSSDSRLSVDNRTLSDENKGNQKDTNLYKNSEDLDDYLIKLDAQSAQDRLEAIFFLKRIPEKNIALALTETFMKETDPMVKAVLIKILPDIISFQPEKVIECLKKSLNDEDNRVRANSVESMEKIFFSNKNFLDEKTLIQMTLPLIKDNDNRTKANALKLFFTFDNDLVLTELEAMLETDKIWMKDSALFALGEIKSSKVVPLLIKSTEDSNEEIRLKAFAKLAEMNDPNLLLPVIEKLFLALANPDHELHYIASMVIEQIQTSCTDTVSYYETNKNFLSVCFDLAIQYNIFDFAEAFFQAQLAKNCIDHDKLKIYIKNLYENKEKSRLLKIMEHIEGKSSLSKELLKQIAETFFAIGHFSRALNYYEKLCSVSDSSSYKYRLGELYLINEMPGKAIKALESVNEADFNPVHIKRLLAEASIQKGLFEKAIKETEIMIERTKDLHQDFRLELIYDIALKFEQAGQSETAKNLYAIIRIENSSFKKDQIQKDIFKNNTAPPLIDNRPDNLHDNLHDHKLDNMPDNRLDNNNASFDIFEDREDRIQDEPDTLIIQKPLQENDFQNNPENFFESRIDPRYKDLKLIGKGGMGRIFRAKDTKLDRLIALKVFSKNIDSSSDQGKRFLMEAQTSAKINHFNIVQIYDFALHNEIAYIVMEYVDGFTIRDLLRKKKIPPVILKRLALQLCEAFIHAHDCGIIHRDIKPENIMINKAGRLKVMDFGIATSDFSETPDSETDIMGTGYYMSPEQFQGLPLDSRSDIYSMGITFYEMLTGKPPFFKGNLKYQHLHVEPEPLVNKIPDLNPHINKIILRCLQKNPALRYYSCRKLLKDWQNVEI